MSDKPYALLADIHLHQWSAFAEVGPDGQNTRLTALISEIKRAGDALLAAGGRNLVVAGDLFHVRGQLSPSVLNPALDAFKELIARDIHVIIIPGNHDLEGRESTRLGSAVTALEGVGCEVIHEPLLLYNMILVPWIESVADLKIGLQRISDERGPNGRENVDLIIHAPINGVIMGIPDHGLEPAWLAALGFKRVFAGHYHNHVVFPGGVHSIGALAHQSWSDVGSKAGFLLVYPDRVEHRLSALPQFVDVAPEMAADDVAKAVKGNYARVKVSTSKLSDIEKMREWLAKEGALGTVILSVKKPVEERAGAGPSITAGASIERSVSDFVKSKGFDPALTEDIEKGALLVLVEAEVA